MYWSRTELREPTLSCISDWETMDFSAVISPEVSTRGVSSTTLFLAWRIKVSVVTSVTLPRFRTMLSPSSRL
ncbi:hypothetical protein [Candidatus Williamhamiltonella defendens]|uniref:hypothetical protein n=1 Tax=Candidatus Williamhamiltonella defendens TaxID=138072 RepID=UPI00387E9C86